MLFKKRERSKNENISVLKRAVFLPRSALRTISLALIFALMIELSPMRAGAAEISPSDIIVDPEFQTVNIFGNDERDDNRSDLLTDDNILEEVIERREENVKHFRLADGRIVAAVYGQPVHELDGSGEWIDIDNSLIMSRNDALFERNQALELPEKPVEPDPISDPAIDAENEPDSANEILLDIEASNNPVEAEPISASDGFFNVGQASVSDTSFDITTTSTTITAPFFNQSPAETQPGTAKTSGFVPEILIPNGGESTDTSVLTTASKSADGSKISFARTARNGLIFSIESQDGIEMKWGLIGVSRNSKTASYSEPEIESGRQKTSVNSQSGLIEYDDIMPGVGLTYQLDGRTIKENIILADRSAAKPLEFSLSLEGLTAEFSENRIIIRNAATGEIYRIISAPYMFDSAGEICVDITLSLSGENGQYIVTLTPDLEWLAADDRAYPVTIDPTFTTEINSQNCNSTTVVSSSPTSSALYNNPVIYFGNHTTYSDTRSIYKFDLPNLTESDSVVGANFKLLQDSWVGAGKICDVSAHQINDYIDLSTATWNGIVGKYAPLEVMDYKTLSAATNTKWASFDITRAVRSWYTTGENYGFTLISHNATGYGTFAGPYTATAKNRPQIEIIYINHAGQPGYLTTQQSGSGSMGAIDVTDYTGNLVYTFFDAATAGSYMPVSVSHVFNNTYRLM